MQVTGYDELVEIGRGASSVVYRARQAAFGRTVALKVLVAAGLDGEDRRRFDRECRAIGGLGWHPRVVPVFDAGTTSTGHPYLAMEFLARGSVADRLRSSGPLPVATALGVATQVADALDAAHAVGVLHRDVKPGNVLVGHFDDVKLADFGIASIASANTSVTESLTGTLAFLAPELLEGGRATECSDVYSVGATLHALLTGTVAFSSATDDTPLAALLRITRDPLPDLRRAGFDDDVASIVERSMARDPADRYPSARALVEAVAAVGRARGWPEERTYAGHGPEGHAEADRSRVVAPAPMPTEPLEDRPDLAAEVPTLLDEPTRQRSAAASLEEPTVRRPPRAPVPPLPVSSLPEPVSEPVSSVPVPVPVPEPVPEADAEPEAQEHGTDHPRRRRWVPVAVAVALLAAVGGAAVALGSRDPGGSTRSLADVAHACDLVDEGVISEVADAEASGPFGAEVDPQASDDDPIPSFFISQCGFGIGGATAEVEDDTLTFSGDTEPGAGLVLVFLVHADDRDSIEAFLGQVPRGVVRPLDGVDDAVLTSEDPSLIEGDDELDETEPSSLPRYSKAVVQRGDAAFLVDAYGSRFEEERAAERMVGALASRIADGLSSTSPAGLVDAFDGDAAEDTSTTSTTSSPTTTAAPTTTVPARQDPPWLAQPPVAATGMNATLLDFFEATTVAKDGCEPMGWDPALWTPPAGSDFLGFLFHMDFGAPSATPDEQEAMAAASMSNVQIWSDGSVTGTWRLTDGTDQLTLLRPSGSPGVFCDYSYGLVTADADLDQIVGAIRRIEGETG